MAPEDVHTLFDGFDPAAYEAEARERWGGTEAYEESARRTKRYGEAEWAELRREVDGIHARLVALLRGGAAPPDAAVQAEVALHRAHLDRWFYPCSAAMHKNLAEMYVADPRFAASYEQLAPGFARFLRDAIAAS